MIRASRSSVWWVVLAGVAGVAVVSLVLDGPLFAALRVHDRSRLESRDWYQALRAAGYLPAWLALGAGVMLRDARGPHGLSRGLRLCLSPALGGLLAEILKVGLARQRPVNNGVGDGAHVWGAPFEAWWRGGGNYGLPSSHAAVSFAGAFVVARLFPRAGWAALALAAGCGLTRMLAGAHFASDVALAGVVGYLAAALTAPAGAPR